MALKAFKKLIDKTVKMNAVLIISYSDNSIVSLDDIIKKMEEKIFCSDQVYST